MAVALQSYVSAQSVTEGSSSANHTKYRMPYLADERDNIQMPVKMLKDKMISALQHRGYDLEAQATVTDLVDRNVRTVSVVVPKDGGLMDHFETVQGAVGSLLRQFSSFNTNEPVLLITLHNALKSLTDEGEALASTTRSLLQHSHSVKPVRLVMMHDKFSGFAGIQQTESAYSLTLLNVVNTDIGGPSMVQLVDDTHSSDNWAQCVEYVEAWDGPTCLWRSQIDDKFGSEISISELEPETDLDEDVRSINSEQTESTGNAHQHGPSLETTDKDAKIDSLSEDKTGFSAASHHSKPSGTVPVALPDEQRVEAPNLDIQHEDLERAPIAHPTWTHIDASQNLLDLVKEQASRLDRKNDEPGFVEEASAGTTPVKAGSEDSFELI